MFIGKILLSFSRERMQNDIKNNTTIIGFLIKVKRYQLLNEFTFAEELCMRYTLTCPTISIQLLTKITDEKHIQQQQHNITLDSYSYNSYDLWGSWLTFILDWSEKTQTKSFSLFPIFSVEWKKKFQIKNLGEFLPFF